VVNAWGPSVAGPAWVLTALPSIIENGVGVATTPPDRAS
jgi:hypothetical protein